MSGKVDSIHHVVSDESDHIVGFDGTSKTVIGWNTRIIHCHKYVIFGFKLIKNFCI